MWVSYKVQPYLIHRNTLHVFDVNETCNRIYSESITLGNISKIKIYMCKSINVYSFYESFAGTRSADIPWDKNYEYQIMMFVDDYYRRYKDEHYSRTKLKRFTIVANINDSEMNAIVSRAVKCVTEAGYPTPFIERYSGQYIDFPDNNTIFNIISDNFRPRTKVLIELTRNSELYVSMLPDERRWRHITERNHPIVSDIHFKGMSLASGNGTIVVEDYCKWYNLYRVHRNDNNELTVTSCDKRDEIIRDMDIEWYDHCPIPSSVVAQCKKHGVKLGYMSYLTMLCRLEEYVLEDELTSAYISPKEDLDEVLVWDGGSCEYFGIAKLFSVARKFDIKCNLFAPNFSNRIEVVNSQQDNNPDGFLEKNKKNGYGATEVPASFDSMTEDEYTKLVRPPYFSIKRTTDPWSSETTNMSDSKNNAEVTLPMSQVKLTKAYKQMTYDSVIMCPHCLHSEPVSITQTIKIQTKGDTSINHFVTDVQMYRDDISMTCPKCGLTTPSAPMIDAEIYPTIKILNEKGYYTDFCCSGHCDGYTGETNYAYISFGPVSKMAERSGIYDNISDNIPDTWYLDMMTDYFNTGNRNHVIRVRDEVQDNDPDKNYLKDILTWAKQLPNLKE